MEREKLESLLIDYIDGKLDGLEKETIEKELIENTKTQHLYSQLKEVVNAMDVASEFELSASHGKSFQEMLKREMATQTQSRTIFFTPVMYRAAAAIALILSGVAIGYWINESNQHDQELAALKTEMQATKQLMLSMMSDNQSASQRMQGVNVALTISRADDEIVKALSNTLNEDPNTNVRLAALDALSKFIDEEIVRRALVTSLSKQNDPIVQIALIQLLVRMKEKSVVNTLEKIIENEKNLPAVKDEAYTGILKLS